MSISRRGVIATAATAAATTLLPGRPARAQTASLKIGVLTDMSGTYQDVGGQVSVQCARQAVEDYKKAGGTIDVEIIAADHLNKPDNAVSIARQWFDRDGVDMLIDVPNSGVGLALLGVAKEKNKVYINTGGATSDLTGPQCNANSIHWGYDTYMLAKSTGGATVKAGGDSWFFITADYAFGKALQRDTTAFVEAAGGKVVSSITYPFPGTTDFSSTLIQAQSSGAKVLGLASAGIDTINQIKQSKEFGITMQLAGLLVFISDVHGLGLETAQGLTITNSFYWDFDDRTRAFTTRVQPKIPGKRPGMVQAGTYAGSLHYLKVAQAMGAADAKKDGAETVARMKATPTDDDCFGKGSIRQDGVALHPAYLWQVKKPSESKGAWDYLKLLATTPADQAFRPLNETGCPLVKA
ncbi:MAG: ABC transporter substrate-binding protein [Acetobacteraceae bacterium]|nr:ABC transporter substrate-binding protein [Acetobacteraceae bacterium]